MNTFRKRWSPFLFSITVFILVFLWLTPTGYCQTPAQPATPADNTVGYVPHISDIHFNPFYDPTLSAQLIKTDATGWEAIYKTSQVQGYGTVSQSETNYNLLVSALANMAQIGTKPDFIIFTGDFLCHNFNDTFKANSSPTDDLDAFIDKTFSFMALMFNKYFPKTPVYISLGNNDCYTGDYQVVADGTFLHHSSVIISENLLQDPENKVSFMATYPTGGYYAVTPPASPNTVIISLNSIFFSPKHTNPPDNDPALKELQWFEAQLKQAQQTNRKVWLLLHIPPGANVFSSLSKKQYTPMWQDAYNTQFIQLLNTYAPIFTAGFCGHTHMDDYRILQGQQTPANSLGFIRISPAISPQFGNNPAYQQMSYNRQPFTLIGYDVFYMNLETPDPGTTGWKKEYNFNTTYDQPIITATSLIAVYNAINNVDETRKNYMQFYDASDITSPELNENNWKGYWCGIGFWISTTFNSCLGTGQ